MSRHFKPHNKLFGTIPTSFLGIIFFQKKNRKKKTRKTVKEEKVKTYKYIISKPKYANILYKSRVENLRRKKNQRNLFKFVSDNCVYIYNKIFK